MENREKVNIPDSYWNNKWINILLFAGNLMFIPFTIALFLSNQLLWFEKALLTGALISYIIYFFLFLLKKKIWKLFCSLGLALYFSLMALWLLHVNLNWITAIVGIGSNLLFALINFFFVMKWLIFLFQKKN